MGGVVTAAVLVASLVLVVAGAAKLRRPAVAGEALQAIGLPGGAGLVRTLAAFEVALGLACLVAGARLLPAAVAIVYSAFAMVAIQLRRRRQPCGCFGVEEEPSSAWHWALSGAFAGLSALAVAWPVHPLGWILDRPPMTAVATIIGVVGAAYASVLVYTELPSAWEAWLRP